MRLHLAHALACVGIAASAALPLHAADPVRELHGMADAFAVPGIALAWGVLRGADEAHTTVILRVVTNAAEFPEVAVTATDPFTQRTVALPISTLSPGRVEVRVARTHFADFPRTDLRFYAASRANASDPPKLVVYYLGVPDTTPELATEAALDASLDERLRRAGGTTKTP